MICVSVIVPFQNAEPTLARCVEALLSQDFPADAYEVLLVDNNSTDAFARLVPQSPSLRRLHEAKQGAYAARNRGVTQARGEILAFTDADCVPCSDWLREICRLMEVPGIGVVLGSSLPARESLSLSLLADYEDAKNEYIFGSGRKDLYYGWTRNLAIRRSLFDEVGPFVERPRGSDVILVRQCVDRYSCELVRYSPSVRVQHLELCSAGAYFGKVLVYGRSYQEYRHVAKARSLSHLERWEVFCRTVQSRRYSAARSLLLLGLLGLGLIYWLLGSLDARRRAGRREAKPR